MKKIILLFLMLLIFAILGCGPETKAAVSTNPIASVKGGTIYSQNPLVIRAYCPALSIALNPGTNTVPVETAVILSNISPKTLKIDGLRPVAVETLSPTSARYKFIVPPGKPSVVQASITTGPSFSFAIMGDNRDGRQVYLNLISQINAAAPSFTLNGGDLVPAGKKEQYDTFIADSAKFTMPYYTVLGNHDIGGDGRAIYNRLLAPNYYDFVWGNARFIVLDNANGQIDAAQFAWLEGLLKNRTTGHVFLIMHEPPFDPRPGQQHTMDKTEQNDKLIQLAAQYQVTAVFASHIHMFAQAEKMGIPYYITGGAGAPLYAKPSAGGFYHYLMVKVAGEAVEVTPVSIEE